MFVDLDAVITQADFADLVGVSRQAISALVVDGKLPAAATLRQLIVGYCGRLREQAAGRAGAGELDLVQERAALARSQREAQDMKNAVARGEFAPVAVLADVLAAASASVADRMDSFEGAVRKQCPEAPDEVRTVLMHALASARNEWVRSTASILEARLNEYYEEDPAEPSLAEGEGLDQGLLS